MDLEEMASECVLFVRWHGRRRPVSDRIVWRMRLWGVDCPRAGPGQGRHIFADPDPDPEGQGQANAGPGPDPP